MKQCHLYKYDVSCMDRERNSNFLNCTMQEIEPRVAEELCRLFPMDEGIDMTPILRKSKEAARIVRPRLSRSVRRREVLPPLPHIRPLPRSFGTPGRTGHNNNNHISGRYTGLCSSCLGLMNRFIESVTHIGQSRMCFEWPRLRLTGVIQLCSVSVKTFMLNVACEPVLPRLPIVII